MPPIYIDTLLQLASHWMLCGLLLILGACLVLDETSIAQTWLSQPLPAGLLAGLVVDDPLLGAAIGVPLQLATLGNLPVGQFFVGEIVTPLIGAIGAIGMAGSFLPVDGTLIGWTFLGVILASIAGDRIVRYQRNFNFRLMTSGLRSLQDGRLEYLERAHYRCLGLTFTRGLIGALFWLLVFSLFWLPAFSHLPGRIREACDLLVKFTPAIALGSMLELRGTRHGLAWMTLGFILTFLLLYLTGRAVS